MSLESLLIEFVLLAGVAALVTALINVAKKLGIIKDGNAPMANLILNLIGFVLFVIANVAGIPTAGIDAVLGSVAALLTALLGLLGQFVVSRAMHAGLRGVPLIGYSHSYQVRG